MTAMILKELKVNLKWALALGAAWSVCFIPFVLGWLSDPTRAYRDILVFEAQAITVVGFPLVGFLLGLAQMLPESRRDAWAFLVHRPLSRGRIFWCKAIAGLFLYFGAILLPLCIFVVWLVRPGRLAVPFDWGVLRPASADLATGVVYYFAGLLVAMRQARWIGSRLWPLLAAAFVSFLVCDLGGRPDATGMPFPLSTLLPFPKFLIFAVSASVALAAYGALQSGGTSGRQPRLCQWGLGAVLTVAGCLVFGLCILIPGACVSSMEIRHIQSAQMQAYRTRQEHAPRNLRVLRTLVTEDGSVVSAVFEHPQTPESRAGNAENTTQSLTGTIVAVLNQAGQELPNFQSYVGKPLSDLSGDKLIMMEFDSGFGPVSAAWAERERPGYRQLAAYWAMARQDRIPHTPVGEVNWVYFPRFGRFFGYSDRGDFSLTWKAVPSCQPLGSAGPEGFQPTVPPDGPGFGALVNGFGPYADRGTDSPLWVATQSEVWWLDIKTREVQRVLALPKGETVVSTIARRDGQRNASWYGSEDLEKALLRENFYVLTQSGHVLFCNRAAGELADIALQGIAEPDDPVQAGYIPGRDHFYVQTKSEFLDYAKNGEVRARFTLPEHPPIQRYLAADATSGSANMATVKTVVIRPSPSVPAMRLMEIAGTSIHAAISLWSPDYSAPRRRTTAWMWEYSWPSLAFALVTLGLCYWWVRKRALPRGQRTAWLLAALAFGPGVLLALWGFYDSPAKEPCPACGRKRLVTRERCEHCGAPFALPAPMGIEILEPAE